MKHWQIISTSLLLAGTTHGAHADIPSSITHCLANKQHIGELLVALRLSPYALNGPIRNSVAKARDGGSYHGAETTVVQLPLKRLGTVVRRFDQRGRLSFISASAITGGHYLHFRYDHLAKGAVEVAKEKVITSKTNWQALAYASDGKSASFSSLKPRWSWSYNFCTIRETIADIEVTYQLNAQGQLIKRTLKNKQGEHSVSTFGYNLDGGLARLRTFAYDKDKAQLGERSNHYEFDVNGNWTSLRHISKGQSEHKAKRSIRFLHATN